MHPSCSPLCLAMAASSYFHFILLLATSCHSSALSPFTDFTLDNYTWTSESLLETHFNIIDMPACGLLCASQTECSGYTWHGESQDLYFSYVCSLFRDGIL